MKNKHFPNFVSYTPPRNLKHYPNNNSDNDVHYSIKKKAKNNENNKIITTENDDDNNNESNKPLSTADFQALVLRRFDDNESQNKLRFDKIELQNKLLVQYNTNRDTVS